MKISETTTTVTTLDTSIDKARGWIEAVFATSEKGHSVAGGPDAATVETHVGVMKAWASRAGWDLPELFTDPTTRGCVTRINLTAVAAPFTELMARAVEQTKVDVSRMIDERDATPPTETE